MGLGEVQKDDQLQALRNTKSGRLFVIGNGPSLMEQVDLMPQMNKEDTFVVNNFFRKYQPFTPTYYAANFVEWKEKRIDPVPGPSYVISGLRFFLNSGPFTDTPGWIQVQKDRSNANVGVLGLGETVLTTIPTCATSPYVMAQLGGWMGYDEIYFLGCEQTNGYWYDKTAHRPHANWLDRINGKSWAILKEQYTKAGKEIWDCTPNGLLNGLLGYKPLEEVLSGTT